MTDHSCTFSVGQESAAAATTHGICVTILCIRRNRWTHVHREQDALEWATFFLPWKIDELVNVGRATTFERWMPVDGTSPSCLRHQQAHQRGQEIIPSMSHFLFVFRLSRSRLIFKLPHTASRGETGIVGGIFQGHCVWADECRRI